MRPEFEWHADDEQGDGETIARTPQRRGFRLPGWVKRAALILLLSGVGLAAVGYGVMRVRYARLRARAEVEIAQLVGVESRTSRMKGGVTQGREGVRAPGEDRLKAGTMNGEMIGGTDAALGVSIEEVELRGDVAWVEVVEGEVRRARFFERRAAAGAGQVGWAETTPRVEFWGAEGEMQSGDLIVRYRQRDEPAVRALLPYLEKVATAVAEDLRYNLSGRKVLVVVSPEEGPLPLTRNTPIGAQTFRREIRLTSPWVSGMPADGVWDQEWLTAISYKVAHGLAQRAARSSAQTGLEPLQRALADEYAAWVSHGRDREQAPLLGRVVERHGEARLPVIFLSLKGSRLPALFVVQWLGLYPSGDAAAFFELLLNVEREALLVGRTETFLLFQDPARREEAAAWAERWSATGGGAVLNGEVLIPARVEEVRMAGELARVRVGNPGLVPDAWRGCALVDYAPFDTEEAGSYAQVCPDGEWWSWLQTRRVGRE